VAGFASVIRTLVETLKERKVDLKDVKVAVIDDGIDPQDNYLSSRIAEGWPPDHWNGFETFPPAFYFSSGGHGTKMARLITEVCPEVKLYVAKLEQRASRDGGGQFTAKSAAEV